MRSSHGSSSYIAAPEGVATTGAVAIGAAVREQPQGSMIHGSSSHGSSSHGSNTRGAVAAGAVAQRSVILEEPNRCVQFISNKVYRLLVTVTDGNEQGCNE